MDSTTTELLDEVQSRICHVAELAALGLDADDALGDAFLACDALRAQLPPS